jgi:hypothetical protein
MCELVEKRVDEILIENYVGMSFSNRPSCEPTREEIDRAIRDKDFDTRGYQKHINELRDEWNRDNSTPQQYNQREQEYHARHIADFAANGWDNPPVLKNDGRSVHGGLHRIKAAKHRGNMAITVWVMCS